MDLYRAQSEGLKLSINGPLSQEERALAGIRSHAHEIRQQCGKGKLHQAGE